MKRTKRESLIALLTAAFLLFAFTACTPQIAPSSSGGGVPSGTPGETSSKPPEILASFGFDMEVPGILMGEMEGAAVSVKEFDYAGGELKINLYFSSGIGTEGFMELGVFVFCDGVPTEYTVLESGETALYNIFKVEASTTVKISLKPDFDLGLGRIDVHVVPLPKEKASINNTAVTTIHAVLPEGYQAEGTYSSVIGDVADARIVAKPEFLKNNKFTVTNIFVVDPTQQMIGSGTTTYEIAGKEETRIGVYVPAPGKYRMVFLLDGEPIALEDGKTVLNCEFGEDEMFSAIVPLKQMIPPGEHSLMAVATRVDEQTYQSPQSCYNLSSFRVGIVN